MNNIIDLKPSALSSNEKTPGQKRTPGDVGSSLFSDLLVQKTDPSRNGGKSLIPYQGKGVTHRKVFVKNSDHGPNAIRRLDREIRHFGVLSSHLVLPGSAFPQLVSFLEGQGFSKKEIDQLILSAKDKDGFLKLDKLLGKLLRGEAGLDQEKKNIHVIKSKDIPQLEIFLFNMGLGVEGVREVIEKTINSNGDLIMTRLSDVLGKFFSGSPSEKDLSSLLKHLNIQSEHQSIDHGVIDHDLKKEFLNFSQAPSQDFQKKIKQNIAALLREKGIPPQQVKSFLETLNVDYTRSLLKKANPKTIEATELLNRIDINHHQDWHRGGWHEKIFEILKGERLLITKNSMTGLIKEQDGLQLNLSELLKHGDQKATVDILRHISENGIWSKLVNAEPRIKNSNDPRAKSLMRDAVGTGIAQLKTDKGINQIAPVDPARGAHNLPQPLPKILERMIWMIRAGEQNSRLVIHPPELGRLDLDLVIRHGHLQANLSAESVMVKELIETNLNQLRQQLTHQGLVVDSFEVMVGLDHRQFKERNMWTANRGKGSSSERSKPAIEGGLSTEEEQPGNRLSNIYKIDVHV